MRRYNRLTPLQAYHCYRTCTDRAAQRKIAECLNLVLMRSGLVVGYTALDIFPRHMIEEKLTNYWVKKEWRKIEL